MVLQVARLICAVSWMVLILAPLALAQSVTATFSGIVNDASGGALPGADVVLTSNATGIVESQVTTATGEFVFSFVPGGTYTLTISIPGFKTHVAKDIALGAAQNVRRVFELELGDLAENITVSGAAPLINTASAEQRIELDTLELATLPTANRNITNLLNIGTGLTRQEGTVEGGGSGSGGAGGIRLRLNGLGGAAMSITANGTEASANAGSRQISSYNGISKIDIVSMESIGEVQIVKGVMPAEFGHALAGNLNVITKSGTNTWHGSAFHRYEGAGLVAKPFFLRDKPPNEWHQGGGSLGGPILRDRAFFFAAFEGFRQTRALELNVNVPTQRFRDLVLASMPYPETRLFLDQYALPNQPTAPNALTGVFIGAGNKENDDDHVDFRGDWRVMGGNLSFNYTYGHPSLTQDSQLPGQSRVWASNLTRISANYSIARGKWSYETRLGYIDNWLSRTDPGYLLQDPIKPGPSGLEDKQRRQLPLITFPGLQAISSEQHTRGQQPSYSFNQQVVRVTDRHSFKFGGIWQTPRGGRFNVTGPTFNFQNEAQLVANRPSAATFRLREVEGLWSTVNWGLFVQDDWRVNNSLVVNLGIRYDWFSRYIFTATDPSNPAGIVNLDGLPDPTFTFGPPRSPDRIYEDDAMNIGPRVGFAYNPGGTGRTVVTGAWGLMFQPFDTQNFETAIGMTSGLPATRNFTSVDVQQLGIQYPIYNEDMRARLQATHVAGPLDPVFRLVDPNLQAPYAMVYSGGIQRALGQATMVDLAYVGTRGYKFRMSRTYNQPDRFTGLRPNPALQAGAYIDNSQQTTYDSLQTAVRQRLTSNLQFNLNYTLSSTRSNYDGDNPLNSVNDAGETIQEFFDTDTNWGPAIGDSRHVFIGTVIYEIPELSRGPRVIRPVIGGWQISGIFRARSGEPITVTQATVRAGSRPDLVDGSNVYIGTCCNIYENNMQYLNRAAFQTIPLTSVNEPIRPGSSGNGQFRLPGFKNLDVSLTKSIGIGGQRRLELRADVLNAFNWVNYVSVQSNIAAANFGVINGTGAARVAQLQARFSF